MAEFRPRLFLLTPRVSALAEIEAQLGVALGAADVACVLLRTAPLLERAAKDLVRQVGALVQPRGIALLVEDARLAAHAGADGAHISGFGAAFTEALDSLRPERIVGIGGTLTRDEAMRAGEGGADYLMFDAGPDDPDQTLERAGWWAEIFNVPCVGVAHRLDEVAALATTGAEFIGLAESFWQDPRGLAAAVGEAQAALDRIAAQSGVPA